jgi:hypothetical protein
LKKQPDFIDLMADVQSLVGNARLFLWGRVRKGRVLPWANFNVHTPHYDIEFAYMRERPADLIAALRWVLNKEKKQSFQSRVFTVDALPKGTVIYGIVTKRNRGEIYLHLQDTSSAEVTLRQKDARKILSVLEDLFPEPQPETASV